MINAIEDFSKNKLLLILICINMFNPMGIGQDLNLIIDSDTTNRTITGPCERNNKVLIPYIDLSPHSKIIVFDKESHEFLIVDEYKEIDFARGCPLGLNSNFYLYGKDRSERKALKLIKTDSHYQPIWDKEILTKGDYNLPNKSTTIHSSIYLSGNIKYDSLEIRPNYLSKVDSAGKVHWTKYYNEDLSYSLPYMTKKSKDEHLLISSAVTSHSEFNRYSQMLKLDTAGNKVWEFYSTEEMEHGAIAPWFVQLSDSTIVQSYRIDERDNDSLLYNNLNRYPYRLVWIDHKTGQVIKRKYIYFHKYTFMYYSGLKEGRGDYFYAYGHWESKQSRIKGLLMKYSNSGDTIWQRKYVHPDFNTEGQSTTINGIIENEDGTIIIVATINVNNDYNKTWLFSVDSNGCFQTDSCEEVIVVNTHENKYRQKEIKVYPNPVDDIIYVEPSVNLSLYGARFHLYDVHGRRVKDCMIKQGQSSISVSNLDPGIYFYKVIVEGKDISSGKLIK